MNKLKPTILAAVCASMLSACGGGDGGSASTPADSVPPTNPHTSVITGKAIDGYLVGAKVCLDLNTNGTCDNGEPTGVTDANGGFSLPYSDNATGERLLVQVTPDTRDLSRPDGFRFPASFTLSAIAGSATSQNVSPFTAMVVAQMEAGMTETEAIAAVQALLGGPVDLAADYVATGDTATAGAASQIVDKITALAANGKADATAVRSVLNAILAKGDVTSVTQADVDAQAAKPVYALADAAQVLAAPVYSFVDSYMTNLDGPTQRIEQFIDGQLRTAYQSRDVGDTVWKDLPNNKQTSFIEPRAQFVMKADGSWSNLLTPADWRVPVSVTKTGRTLTGKDPVTGIGITYEERQADLSGQPATLAVSGTLFGPDISVYPSLAATFPSGTSGYLAIQSYAEDRVVLPLSMSTICEFPYLKNDSCPSGLGIGVNLPPYDPGRSPYDPNQPINDAALPSPLTSIRQLVGLNIVESTFLFGSSIEITDGGTARIHLVGGALPPGTEQLINATWSTYSRNPNVMVFDMSHTDAAIIAGRGDNPWAIGQGAKLVLAIRGGQLQSGLLFPAGYGQRTVQFSNSLPALLTTPVNINALLSNLPKSAK
ncbi:MULTISPECIES: hypothetical protein [Cupriavidus]